MPWYRRLLLLLFASLLIGGPAFADTNQVFDHFQKARQLTQAGSYHEALSEAQQALQLGEEELGATDPRLAPLVNEMAVLCYRLGRYRDAESHFKRALQLKRRMFPTEDPQIALALNNLASAHHALGHLGEAEALQKKAWQINEKAYGPNHPVVAEDLNNLASILQDKGDYSQALELYHKSLPIFQTAPVRDARRLAGLHNNLALVYKLQGRFAMARKHYEKALAEAEEAFGENHPMVARIAGNVAVLYRDDGDFHRAENCFRRALSIYGHRPAELLGETAVVLNNYAALLTDQERLKEARFLYRQALDFQTRTLGKEHHMIGVLYNNLGELEEKNGNPAEAEKYLLKAEQIWRRGQEPSELRLAAVLNNLGRLHLRQGNLKRAEKELRQALQMTEKCLGKNHYQKVEPLANLADILKRQGAFDEANRLLKEALALAEKNLPSNHPQTAEILNSLAALHFEQNQTLLAEDYNRRAADIVCTRLRNGWVDGTERRRLRHILLNRVGILYRLAQAQPQQSDKWLGQAFETAQWAYVSRAGQAIDRMATRFATGHDDLARLTRRRQDGLERQQRLERMLDEILLAPPQQSSPAEETEICRLLGMVEKDIDATTTELVRRFPRYAELEIPTVVNTDGAARYLADDEALLLTLSGEGESYLWLLKRNNLTMHRLPFGANVLTERVAALRLGLDQSDVIFADELRPFDLELSQSLYRDIVGPVEENLGRVSRLITVVEGALLELPFSVLVKSFPQNMQPQQPDYAGAEWLIDRCSLLRLPTVAALVQLRHEVRTSQAPSSFVGFGDPLLTDHWADLRGLARAERSSVAAGDIKSLSRLPETADELKTVAGILGANEKQLFLGAAMTEERVRSMDLHNFRVLAFASHALLAGDLPGLKEPALVLTPPQDDAGGDDGLLTASEIANLELDAQLVILSACNTAAADGSARGEGLSGLARAFFFAGSRGVMVSHWPVGSRATAELMTRFFQHREEQGNSPRALATAMSEMVHASDREFSHPMFWAPFLIIGAEPES